MDKFKVILFANTFAIIDLILHSLFHVWVSISPHSYEWIMNFFVAGLHLRVTDFDISFGHIVLSSILEATVFWILGASFALIYNLLSKDKK